MDISIKDRDSKTDQIRMVLNMVGIGVDYKTTVLLLDAISLYEMKKGKTDLLDASKLENSWQKKMDDYFKKLKNKKS